MAALTFDDVPEAGSSQPAPASGPLTFEDVPEAGQAQPAPADNSWYQTAANVANRLENATHLGYAANRVASNLPFADRATAGAMTLEGKLGVGGADPNAGYGTNLKQVRAYNEELQKEHPYQELAATVAGGALMPMGAVGEVARAPTLTNMAIRGGVLGGGIGAVQGTSEIPDYSKVNAQDVGNVGKQAGMGAAMGAGIPLVGSALGGAYRGIRNAVNGHVPGLSTPAQNVLTQAVANDDAARAIPALQALGPQGMVLDTGPSFKGIASGLANADSPQAMAARGNLRTVLETRNEGADERLAQSLHGNLGPPVNSDAVNAGMGTQLDALGPGILDSVKAAQGAGVKVDTTDVLANLGGKLADAQGNPKVVGVLNQVKKQLLDPVMDPQGKPIQGLVQPVTDPLKLHNAKGYLDGIIDHGDLNLNISKGDISPTQGAVANLRGELNQSLRDAVPGYADVNDQVSSLFRQQEQLAAGKSKVLSGNAQTALHPDSHAATFNPLPPVEQQAQTQGTKALLDATLGVKGNDLSAINTTLQGPNGWNTQKLMNQHGQQPVQNLVDTAGAEQKMRGNYNTIAQGTETANRLAMVNALKGVAPSAQPPTIPYFPSSGIASGLGNIPIGGINKVIDAFRRVPNDATFYNQLGKAVTTQGPEGQALIEALKNTGANRAANQTAGDKLRYRAMLGMALAPNTMNAVNPPHTGLVVNSNGTGGTFIPPGRAPGQ